MSPNTQMKILNNLPYKTPIHIAQSHLQSKMDTILNNKIDATNLLIEKELRHLEITRCNLTGVLND